MNRIAQTVLTWAVVYPLITALLWVGEPWLGPLPLALRTLLVTLILVPVMSFAALPAATALIHRLKRALTKT